MTRWSRCGPNDLKSLTALTSKPLSVSGVHHQFPGSVSQRPTVPRFVQGTWDWSARCITRGRSYPPITATALQVRFANERWLEDPALPVCLVKAARLGVGACLALLN